MKDLGHFKSRKEWENYIWNQFLNGLVKENSFNKINAVMKSVISRKEQKFIVNRIIAIEMIKKGKSYSEISNIAWLSPATISAIKKSLNSGEGYKARDKKDKKGHTGNNIKVNQTAEFIKAFFDYWINVPIPTKIGKGRWKFLNYQG